ncbi:GNAT family N-acetyltransferase [Alteribacter keqinensis]|uniref:N-acetyltransferase n=1 Tax=Alteribacter keqinensis TaxID=2483800 RepID=A0A3M7TU71_9BACI|nr:GNAT family N-acetyltransferase [Alteribacter keqinensis]RNA69077.1 N-acetyltransferase [Alteribacter keqinensis]
MIIPYHRDYEKIAMGLLSYTPNEKKVKKLQHTMKQYETEQNWQLYFWKEEEAIIGVIGIEIEENTAYLHHLCVNPSYREEGIGTKMVRELEKYTGHKLSSTKSTSSFLESCQSQKE